MNRGLFLINSTKMHPIAHMSTPKEYSFFPKRISGALYHRVSTSWVRVLIGIVKALASPKSQSLTFPFYVTRRFCGLRSL